MGKPSWLKTKIPGGKRFFQLKDELRRGSLHTVCEEASCPNIDTCWNEKTATFMILGRVCTRACRFCHVETATVGEEVKSAEGAELALSCRLRGLNYVVLTMVDRDDLVDGGAAHSVAVVERVRLENPGIKVEFLSGDFGGNSQNLQRFLEVQPEVYAHNLETVERLTPRVRDARASYRQSLRTLEEAKSLLRPTSFSKSGLMLGLGEEDQEIEQALLDLRKVGVNILTLGQYLQPTPKHRRVHRYVTPEAFAEWEKLAYSMGFDGVASAPLVRSSYRAAEFYQQALVRSRVA